MNGRHPAIVAVISLAASGPVFAGDSDSPVFTPRQMAHCMMKRLRANTAESYRDAYKACKSQFDSARSDRAADTAMAAAARPQNPKE